MLFTLQFYAEAIRSHGNHPSRQKNLQEQISSALISVDGMKTKTFVIERRGEVNRKINRRLKMLQVESLIINRSER